MDLSQLAAQLASLDPAQRASLITTAALGFDHDLGIRWVHVAADRVVAELPTAPRHTQPYGLVHGGVYCALAEATCSVGAAMSLLPRGQHAVGVENHTRFLRATRPGSTLTVVAQPLELRGRQHQWRARILDPDGALVAEGTVVVRALDANTTLAGERVALKAAGQGDA